MNRRSTWAVAAGIVVAIVVTTLIDIVLHLTGVYQPMGQPLTDALAVLATTYRVVVGIGSAWLTARLAPARPMKHAMILGTLGMIVAIAGVITTWNLGLGPRWYPIALVVLALPQSWAGAKIFEARPPRAASPLVAG